MKREVSWRCKAGSEGIDGSGSHGRTTTATAQCQEGGRARIGGKLGFRLGGSDKADGKSKDRGRTWPTLIEEFQKMDFDLRLGGSGGDYDPDDGLVDWMQTASKFNGPTRNKDEMPFGFFAESEVDAATDEQAVTADPEARRALVQKANKITSDKVACGFLFHPVDILVHSASVNVPPESRIPGLHDFDRMTLS